jgi:hypothetical protein
MANSNTTGAAPHKTSRRFFLVATAAAMPALALPAMALPGPSDSLGLTRWTERQVLVERLRAIHTEIEDARAPVCDLCFDLDLIMPRWQRRCVADTVQLGTGEARDIIGAHIAIMGGDVIRNAALTFSGCSLPVSRSSNIALTTSSFPGKFAGSIARIL